MIVHDIDEYPPTPQTPVGMRDARDVSERERRSTQNILLRTVNAAGRSAQLQRDAAALLATLAADDVEESAPDMLAQAVAAAHALTNALAGLAATARVERMAA